MFKELITLLLPLVHIGLTGSVYLTVAVALERYTTVCHPFFKVCTYTTDKIAIEWRLSAKPPSRCVLTTDKIAIEWR
jgi:hypothetical protein